MRRLAATSVLVAALAVALAPPAGAANPQIAGLQVALRAQGLYCGPIDGIAGPQTRDAVRRFQARAGLAADGLPGPKTRAALGPLGGPLLGRRVLRRGAFGWDVSVLQFLLARRGFFAGALDGYFGPATARALRRYQRSRGLAADAVAGPATLASFRGVPVRQRPKAVLVAAISPADVRGLIDWWSSRYGVDPALARALAWMESGFQPQVVSGAGAWGVMQVTPAAWDFVEEVVLGRDVPRTTSGNVRVGVALLRHLLRRFGGDERLALGAWYQGEQAVRDHGLYPETRRFVANVLALRPRV